VKREKLRGREWTDSGWGGVQGTVRAFVMSKKKPKKLASRKISQKLDYKETGEQKENLDGRFVNGGYEGTTSYIFFKRNGDRHLPC